MKTLSLALLTFMIATTALAQQTVDERRQIFPDASIKISNVAGKVTVVGTSAAELHVTGTMDSNLKLEITGKNNQISVEVVYPKSSSSEGAFIEVQVPNGSNVLVSTISADIDMRDLKQPCKATSVSGDINIIEGIERAATNTVSGDIEIRSKVSSLQMETVSGNITVHDASERISSSSVSGDMTIAAGSVVQIAVNSVSGNITLNVNGSLAAAGRIEAQSHSGDVHLTLPSGTDAEVQVQRMSGSRIRNDFGKRNGAKQGGALVRVGSFSGNIIVDEK